MSERQVKITHHVKNHNLVIKDHPPTDADAECGGGSSDKGSNVDRRVF